MRDIEENNGTLQNIWGTWAIKRNTKISAVCLRFWKEVDSEISMQQKVSTRFAKALSPEYYLDTPDRESLSPVRVLDKPSEGFGVDQENLNHFIESAQEDNADEFIENGCEPALTPDDIAMDMLAQIEGREDESLMQWTQCNASIAVPTDTKMLPAPVSTGGEIDDLVPMIFDKETRKAFASDPTTPPSILETLAEDKDVTVALRAQKTLRELWTDVRSRSQITLEDGIKAILENYTQTRFNEAAITWMRAIAAHPQAPAHVLKMVAQYDAEPVMVALVHNPATPPEVYELLLRDDGFEVKWNLAGCNLTPEAIVERLALDPNLHISARAKRTLAARPAGHFVDACRRAA